jgi:hypothetical protein
MQGMPFCKRAQNMNGKNKRTPKPGTGSGLPLSIYCGGFFLKKNEEKNQTGNDEGGAIGREGNAVGRLQAGGGAHAILTAG